MHYIVKLENTKITFSLKCCISALYEFNQLLDFFNLFDSRLILMLLYDSLNVFSLVLLGTWFRINEVERAEAVELCCTHNAPILYLLSFLFRKVMQND